MPSEHSNRGAKRAREARIALGLDPAEPVVCLLTLVEEQARLPVVVAGLPEGVAGACYRHGERAILWVNGNQGHARQRFTLAHELAHVWCKHDGRLEVDTFATLGGRTTNPYEVQANAFAAEFLVPKAGVKELMSAAPTLDEVVTVANVYGVNPIVVVFRLKQLGLAEDTRIERLEAEVAEQLDVAIAERIGLERRADRIARIESLPYLSPTLRGTQLEAGLRGRTPVDARLGGAIDRLALTHPAHQ
jgi:Zn-dependent peptidase ImmA (M78 family)